MKEKYKCPNCGNTDQIYIIQNNKLICEACKHKFLMDNKTKKQRKINREGIADL